VSTLNTQDAKWYYLVVKKQWKWSKHQIAAHNTIFLSKKAIDIPEATRKVLFASGSFGVEIAITRETNLNALLLAVGSVTWQIHWEPPVEVKHFSLYVSYTKVLFNNQHPVGRIGRIYIVILIFRRHNTAGIISHKHFETANTTWSRFHQSCNVSLSLKARKPIVQF